MDQRLAQTQTQKLILSPLIRQYLRLLQLPVAELATAVEQELAENPALEEVAQGPGEDLAPSPNGEERKNETAAEELRFDQTLQALDKLDEGLYDSLYHQEDFALPDKEQVKNLKNYEETLVTRKESLYDYLLWQLGFLELTAEERQIAEEIVGNLTVEGFLLTPLEEIVQACQTTVPDVEKVLSTVQGLDPAGIAARNLQETLLLQLERKGPAADLAKRIVKDHLPLLERKQWEPIAKLIDAPVEQIREAAQLIAHLDPKPGTTFYGEDSTAVTPDARVYFDDAEEGKLNIEVTDEEIPELRVSSYYRKLARDSKLDEASRKFLKEKIQAALEFVKALGQRRSTLYQITEELVRAQREFFEKGFSHLKPLRLKDISARLGIHESTVSRALQGKYVSTPRGTVPFKSFFSTKLETAQGDGESQKSIMEKIREMIRGESPENPLSDQAMASQLQKDGIRIARRTVAKYRELMKILPTHLRRNK